MSGIRSWRYYRSSFSRSHKEQSCAGTTTLHASHQTHSGAHHELKLSKRAIALQLGISRSSVGRALERAKVRNLSWPLHEDLTEADLRRKLFPNAVARPAQQRKEPDWAQVHQKLRKHRTLALILLWREYNKAHPRGYQKSQHSSGTGTGVPAAWMW